LLPKSNKSQGRSSFSEKKSRNNSISRVYIEDSNENSFNTERVYNNRYVCLLY
jgi:hypothetical protein